MCENNNPVCDNSGNCPFNPLAPVIPFSNGTDAMEWHKNNCGKCLNYEKNQAKPNAPRCEMSLNIDKGFVSGEVPLWVCKEIGCTYDPLYRTVSLFERCTKFNKEVVPF